MPPYPCCDSLSTTVSTRCDNQFYYCLRHHNTSLTTGGCIGYEQTITSTCNENQDDAPIEFSQLTVFGLPNSMTLTGLDTFCVCSDDFVDSFSIKVNEKTTKGSYLTLPGTYNLATIGLTARFMCADKYYEELCERFDYCSAPHTSCSSI